MASTPAKTNNLIGKCAHLVRRCRKFITNFLSGGTEIEDKDIDSIDKDVNRVKVGFSIRFLLAE